LVLSCVALSEVRLVGGSRCSGRLEILDNQTWVSVCAAAFDQQDAEVVCRELDCGAPVQVLGEDAFGKRDGQMWTQEIQCRGNESQIHLCPTSPSHKNTSSYENDIGLVCAGLSFFFNKLKSNVNVPKNYTKYLLISFSLCDTFPLILSLCPYVFTPSLFFI